eukprot:Protomagalhaensia_sp_Gyna_25__1362@NODE_1685_length_1624_cov_610_403785_g1379_i0_p1_GENE_NODE_1685_length_1624_cov_610_403785_g1379_i0NODE_1685_length_1624_cov_610_403785_g1379_i0_p1_ORF_typecomplete_len254_score56_62TIM/PF00121_18/1_8e92CutC/PF03932_14/0_01NAPRTase/PF04095_16/2_9e02NAPRTase/PF04095_16/0_73_NODE_1685_length_1624_cov_610_403785_g1379_i0141902
MVARKPWVGGNWKCNGTKALIEELSKAYTDAKVDSKVIDVVIFPTAIHVSLARSQLPEEIQVGIQNLSKTGNGAYTGEISAEILKDLGLENTLIGHSERRTLYHECDKTVGEKVAVADKAGLKIGLCIGETLEEREANKTMEVCKRQIEAAIPSIKTWDNVVIAYEPVWAIGTGKVATKEQAQEVHHEIRAYLKEKVNPQVADSVRIVYGGSVNEKNCEELAKMPDIDGFLVGGASLKPAFTTIIKTMAAVSH